MKDKPIKFHLDKKILNKKKHITIHECPVSIIRQWSFNF